MKILFVTDLYPVRTGETTTARTLHNFVIEWIKQGCKVDVIKPNFVFNSFLRKKPFYKTDFYEFEGVKVFNVNYHSPFLFDIEKKLPKTIDIASYDVIVAHMPSGIIFANKLAQKYKKPLICAVHCSDIEVLTQSIYKFYFKSKLEKAYQNASAIACRSFVLQKKFNKILHELAEKTFVVPSGIDFKEKGKREKEKDYSQFTILSCANLIKRKNIDKLILAAQDIENLKLTVIGDGAEFKKLRTLVKSSSVEFLGRLPHENVLEEMQKSDVFILPSIRETFGMVYLEAMASGCITVCTKDDGIDGIIRDGENGFLTEPTVEGIRANVLRIINSDNLDEISKNSIETIKNYTSEECAIAYLAQINSHIDNCLRQIKD